MNSELFTGKQGLNWYLNNYKISSRARIILAKMVLLASIILAAGGSFASGVQTALAASYTIGCGDTTGLINAITTANASGGSNTINLAAGCTYQFSAVNNTQTDGPNALPDITSNLTINGNGASLARTTGAPSFRIIHIEATGNLTINNLTITDANPGNDAGGGVYNLGTLTVVGVTFSYNQANFGSAINNLGTATVTGSLFTNNSISQQGTILNTGTLTVDQSTFTNNTANNGGAIFSDGNTTITNSTFNGNTATNSDGGAVNADSGTMNITNSTFYGNIAANNGGGLTSGNGATIATVNIQNSTFFGNKAGTGGGVRVRQGTVNIQNSIIAGSLSGGNCSGTTSLGYNLSDDATCGGSTGDMINTNPKLGPLANNGGSTFTMALLPGSPAIDHGNNLTCAATDQRGLPRPIGPACDIGAYELDEPQPGPVYTVNTSADPGDGICTYLNCTFREAISAANTHSNGTSPDQIQFKIPGQGPFTIVPTSTLPAITDPLIIDGYTQPGASANTLSVGDNAVLQIELNLANAGGSGLTLSAANSTIRGMAINRATGTFAGIVVTGNNSNISGNFIGASLNGMAGLGNGGSGVFINNSSNNLIGGALPAARNIISANGADGILVQGTSAAGNQIQGNLIGLAADGSSALGNKADGVDIQANGTQVGGTAAGAGNLITASGADGVSVVSGSGNSILTNLIFGNTGLGIRLAAGANNNARAPFLVNAIPQTGGTLIQGLLQGAANTAYTLQFFTNTICDPSNSGEGQTYLSQASFTTNISGTANISTTTQALAGFQFVTAVATDPNQNSSAFSQCAVTDIDNTSWPNALSLGSVGPTAQSFSRVQYLGYLGQNRWYKVTLQPGTQVSVRLTNLPASYDLMVFTDINAAYQTSLLNISSSSTAVQSLTSQTAELGSTSYNPGNLAPNTLNPQTVSPEAYSLTALQPGTYSNEVFSPYNFSPYNFSPYNFSPYNFSPYNFSPYNFSPYNFSPYNFSPYNFSPYNFSPVSQAYANAQARSLISASALDGTIDRTITFNSWNNLGDYYIRVLGRNGTFSLAAPYTLQVTATPGACGTINPSLLPATATIKDTNTTYQTLILTDWSRLTQTTDLQTALNSFVPKVGGVLVDVSQDPRVYAANLLADQNPSCPYAKNLVASSIKAIVDQYRGINPGLKYIVILGNDNMIPFFRYPDQSMLGDESGFVPPVDNQSASQASLRLDYFLSQDAYGSGVSLMQNSTTLPLPGLAIGRLVEQPAEIANMLNVFLNTPNNGVLTPTSALVTGYDFMASGASAVQAQLQAGMNNTPVDTLISPAGTAPSQSWTADNLRSKLLQNHYDLLFLDGHFRDSGLLAADYTTQILASEVLSSAVNMTNSIIFSAGCHVGYNTVDSAAVSGVTQQPDWSQALARKGATLIGGTGYQYGDTDSIALSQALYLDFSQQLRIGTGPVAIGQALMAAKQQYLAGKPALRGIDQKAVLEATLYGLPMLSVNLPGKLTTASDPSIAGTLSPYATAPGSVLKLFSSDVTINPALTLQSVKMNTTIGSGIVTASYYSGTNGIVSNPAEPVLPLESRNVSVSNQVLRGVGFLGGSYSDTPGVTPLTSAAGTELRGVHVTFPSSVFYPIRPWTVNYFDALNGGNTRLMITPSQFKGDLTNPQVGTLRAFGPMNFRLFYSNNTTSYGGNIPALSDPPSIAHVFANSGGGNVTFHVSVTGNPSAGIQAVWVTYTDISSPTSGVWQSLFLTQNPNDSTLWESSIPFATPTNLRFMVQAVSGVGLVSLDTNLGAYFIPDIDPAAPSAGNPSAIGTSLTLVSGPTTSAYGNQVTFVAQLQTTSGSPLENLPVSLSLGQQGMIVTTNSSGQASFTLTLLGTPGVYVASVSFNGNSSYISSGTTAVVTIPKQNTTLTLSPNPADVRPGTDSGIVATLKDTAIPTAHPLNEQTIIFVVQPATGAAFDVAAITNMSGQARLGLAPTVGGSYQVTAYYGNTPVLVVPADVRYNSSSAVTTLLVDLPPHTSITSNPPAISNSSSASFSFTGTDDFTPVGSLTFQCSLDNGAFTSCASPQTYTNLTNGSHTFAVRAVDTLGPDPTPASFTWLVDTLPPTVTCASPDTNWHASDVSLACTTSDSGTGLANPAYNTFNLTTSVPAGTETANASTNSIQVCDLAGNCTTAGPISGIKVDKKAPTITILSPNAGPYLLNQVVAASYTCTDGGSGVASCVGTVANGSNINTATPGTNTFKVTAKDAVGNVATVTVNYQVAFNFSGFFSPVANPPILNVMNAGRAVPVKFSLGGNFGLGILAAGYPTSQQIVCPTATTNQVSSTTTATTSSLSFNATTNQYTYVWATSSTWSGTCRQFNLLLTDGTLHIALFMFK